MPRGLVVRTSTPVPLISATALRVLLRYAPVKTLARMPVAPSGRTICAPASSMGIGQSSPVTFQ